LSGDPCSAGGGFKAILGSQVPDQWSKGFSLNIRKQNFLDHLPFFYCYGSESGLLNAHHLIIS
jgi:hypothetical protein